MIIKYSATSGFVISWNWWIIHGFQFNTVNALSGDQYLCQTSKCKLFYFLLSQYKLWLAHAACLSLQSRTSLAVFSQTKYTIASLEGGAWEKMGLGYRNYGIKGFFYFNKLNRREKSFTIKLPWKRKANNNCFNLPQYLHILHYSCANRRDLILPVSTSS